MKREDVYKLIDGERDYQNLKWNIATTSDSKRSLEEWFMYIEDYVNEAKHILSRETRKSRQTADIRAGNIMRKVAAMAVFAMEQHNVEQRTDTRKEDWKEIVTPTPD